jgi:hypothetical protein
VVGAVWRRIVVNAMELLGKFGMGSVWIAYGYRMDEIGRAEQ